MSPITLFLCLTHTWVAGLGSSSRRSAAAAASSTAPSPSSNGEDPCPAWPPPHAVSVSRLLWRAGVHAVGGRAVGGALGPRRVFASGPKGGGEMCGVVMYKPRWISGGGPCVPHATPISNSVHCVPVRGGTHGQRRSSSVGHQAEGAMRRRADGMTAEEGLTSLLGGGVAQRGARV